MIGVESEWRFPYDITFRSGAFYMPGLKGIDEDWLFRWNFEVLIPLWDPLAMRFRMRNINDSNPSAEVGNNKFNTIMGFTLKF